MLGNGMVVMADRLGSVVNGYGIQLVVALTAPTAWVVAGRAEADHTQGCRRRRQHREGRHGASLTSRLVTCRFLNFLNFV